MRIEQVVSTPSRIRGWRNTEAVSSLSHSGLVDIYGMYGGPQTHEKNVPLLGRHHEGGGADTNRHRIRVALVELRRMAGSEARFFSIRVPKKSNGA